MRGSGGDDEKEGVEDGPEDGGRVCELCLLERGVGGPKLSRGDGMQAEGRDGEDGPRFCVVRVPAQGDLERWERGRTGEVQPRGTVEGKEERLQRCEFDRANLAVQESHRGLERTRGDVVGCERRVAHPELRFGDPGHDRTAEVLLDLLLGLVFAAGIVLLLRCEVPRVLGLLGGGSPVNVDAILASPVVEPVRARFAVRVLDRATRGAAFARSGRGERAVKEALRHADRGPILVERGRHDRRRADRREWNGREHADEVVLVQARLRENVLRELDQVVALRGQVREGD